MSRSGPCLPRERIPVPIELRRALVAIDLELGRRKALRKVGVGPVVFEELVTPGGIAQRAVIERVAAVVAAKEEKCTTF